MILEIYTDGSCSGNPGPSGWGFLVITSEDPTKHAYEKFGATTNEEGDIVPCTNQQAEMMALERALQLLVIRQTKSDKELPSEVIIYSDSAYLLNCLKDKWYVNWQKYAKNGVWLTSKKEPVCNQWLWDKMLKNLHFLERLGVKFTYTKVKGHTGDKYNEYADKLANAGTQLAREYLQPLTDG